MTSLVTNSATCHSEPACRVNLLAIGSKEADFSFRMQDTLTGVMTEKLEPRYFGEGAEEGKCYTVDEVCFSFRNGTCYVNQKRVRKDGSVTKTEQSDTRCIYDMLSILAQARPFDPRDYAAGQRIQFPMTTGRKVEEQTLICRDIRKIATKNDMTYRYLIFSLVEYNKEGKKKEVVTFYVTDDRNHLPVWLDMHLDFGSTKAFLRSVSGYCRPQTFIITK